MPAVLPFRALRPRPDLAAAVSAPPYDVIDTAEGRALAADNPDSFLHVSRPEIDLPDDTDPHSQPVYEQGRVALADLITRGVLVRSDRPAFLVYRQTAGAVIQTGITGVVLVDDYSRGAIRKHELTRADKEDDRTQHIDALSAHDEPVFLLSPVLADVRAATTTAMSGPADVDFVAPDGVRHELWTIDDPETITRIQAAFESTPTLYIADGHHRSAAAERVRDLRAGSGQSGEADRFLAVVFAEDELNVMAYNRVVRDLNGMAADAFLAKLGQDFVIEPALTAVAPTTAHEFGIYLDGRWHTARLRPGLVDESDPTARLDVSVLQERVLAPMLGIGDPRTDARIAFVGGIRGTVELERLVDNGDFAVAFSLCPTSVRDLIAIADADQIMPPKSTWFEPKLRSGLFAHEF